MDVRMGISNNCYILCGMDRHRTAKRRTPPMVFVGLGSSFLGLVDLLLFNI